MLTLALASLSVSSVDLARPTTEATRLSDEPFIYVTHNFFSPETVGHMVDRVPKDEAAYTPCIGQVDEFDSKRCALLKVAGDDVLEAALDKVASTYNVDVAQLQEGGLPVIRYLPGAPPVGKHGDEDKHGVVPNATLVVYLTPSTGAGQTIFPEADVAVTPRPGSVLSFTNVDAHGKPHPKGKHWVSAVPADAPRDRLVLQIPIYVRSDGDGVSRRYAHPEHVSGGKKPGQHEYLHGNDAQKAAGAAALAAGFGVAIAYMAAKQGSFDPSKVAEYKQQAEDTGKFVDADFEKKE